MTDSQWEEKKSRSQIKREFGELKALGKRLVGLPLGQLQAVPLSQDTREAVLAAKEMTRSALQRQLRHLSSLMVEENLTAIQEALSGARQPHAKEVTTLHEAERWRDELLSGDENALTRFVDQHPACDRQHLGQLVRNARKEREFDKPPKSARQLFRYLKSLSSEHPVQ